MDLLSQSNKNKNIYIVIVITKNINFDYMINDLIRSKFFPIEI